MTDLYPWLVFIHVAGAFTFALAHGTSVAIAFQLRGERELQRVRALLDVSQRSNGAMYVGLVILLLAGIIAAFVGGLWGKGWIWAANVLLIALVVFMYARATPFYGSLRRAAGLPWFDGRRGQPASEPDEIMLARGLASGRPMELGVVGYAGLIAIVLLMVVKPF